MTDSQQRGRLAQMIATRGGLAPPEAPFVIEHREALIYMLCEAAELEHGIMCQYLYAAFSLKQSEDEGLTKEEAEATSRWRKHISHIAAQEMLHLSLVQNLLSAIGAAPHLSRPNFPQPASHYPAGVNLALIPFGEDALRHFMFLERPEGMDIEDVAGMAAFSRAQPSMQHGDIVPRGQDFATVGHLYRSIERGFADLAGKYGEERLFAGPPQAQATQADFGWPELVGVTDLASAQRAIDEILEQGEGPRGDWKDAHFGQFVAILDEYTELREANPGFDPVRPVVPVNVRPTERDVDIPLASDPVTRRVMDMFNVSYEILLLMLQRFFARTEETPAQLKVLSDGTIAMMLQAIRPLGDLVTTLPAGPEYPGRTAGPSFELFYESDYVLPHREAAWLLLTERIRQAADFCEPGGPCGPVIIDRLGAIRAALNDIADRLAAHLPSRYAPAPAQEAQDRATLLARAQDFYRTGQALPTPADGTPNEVTALLADTCRALQAPEPPLEDLAVSATTLRARLGAGAPPVLLEAVAFLQDLAVKRAPAGERAARIADLGQLQRELPPAIMTARNGPYLVTNVTTLRTPHGEDQPVPPTVALCRCGASATKPLCDGACATSGFTDAKDPKRVPDQRDTYPGTQVTIFDNRGICQHSGLCTDRAPAAFRAAAEPFVAPSGARLDELVRAVRDCPSGALSLAFDGQEARAVTDWNGTRERVIEVTQDGPYRITGGIPLTDADGADVPRAPGSSREHYALCRCGHSQNKPFCSGMHWYVEFRDPASSGDPTLFEWAGGLPALTRMTRLLYEKLVPVDDLLAPLFATMAPGSPQAEAAVMAEAFGGPQAPTPPDLPEFTEEQRARWVALAVQAAQEAVLPADAPFRSALSGYLEWRSRSAGATAARWDWGPAGRPAITEAGTEPDVTAELPGPDETVSFATHVKPLFRERDRKSMSFAFDLWSRADVRAHADGILARLRDGTMPCDGAWPTEQIDVFRRWTETGFQP
ncbi:MAG TPA: ferritin-like domain-containing protein [Streptosporangiaceae bacterium]|nr:ferritin-like domain-containing protein [Streptosporangiaceae bacterium]